MLSEYLDHAITFERMAAEEDDPLLKTQFEKQAAAYRNLAKDRAAPYGLPVPSPPTRQVLTDALRQAVEDTPTINAKSSRNEARQLTGRDLAGNEKGVIGNGGSV